MTMNKHTDPEPWEVIESRYLHKEPWLTMRKDSVRLPNGKNIDDFYVWEYPPWLNVIAITKNDEIVLIRQYRHGIGKVSFELPAGVHDKPGETLLDAAKRELLEETGYGEGTWIKWMELSANPALQTNITHTFLATGVSKISTQRLDETEEITVHPMTFQELTALIEQGEIIQALHAAPIIKYLCSRQSQSGEHSP
ncbi:NUDIX hydrolase [Prosthecochloris sp. SCSIO W1102]|uniref:NUDIX hydrolase n=1 Tax=Prosthecochloris sp. SCSIO W1102 TaxID=2992243 RepID=UPI00223CF887|nr:NUDIX hydrolase [Prosthecochloris sp. SCSIO W1102]UZJ39625.1 NUDIX hydrolase [Prosthecochloris sp. SCSIO W1102]